MKKKREKKIERKKREKREKKKDIEKKKERKKSNIYNIYKFAELGTNNTIQTPGEIDGVEGFYNLFSGLQYLSSITSNAEAKKGVFTQTPKS